MSSHDNWDQHWERYAAAATRNPAQLMRRRMIERLIDRLSDGRPQRLLDIGSGQGDLMLQLRNRFPSAELRGLELSERGVEICREKVPDARFEVADLFRPTPVLDDFSDWATHAVCSEVLEHVDDPVGFVRAASRYLAPRAWMVITVPGGPVSKFDEHIGHRRHFDRESIRAVVEGAGYELKDAWSSGFPFFNLYRLLVILRGARLAEDVESGRQGPGSRAADATMAVFRLLFFFNLWNSPWGWQVVAIAQKRD